MPRTCSIVVLGPFRVDIDGREVPPDAWRHRRGAELVKRLALAPRHRVHREQLVEDLWPDLAPAAGAANLRKALHYARRALRGARAIAHDGELLVLWPDGELTIDLDRFEAAVSGLDEGDRRTAARIVGSFGPDILPDDPYLAWLAAPRERHLRRYAEVLAMGGFWERVLELDPSDERAHRELMRGHLDAGDRYAAMRRFEILREILREELGVAPDRSTVLLYEEVLALEGTEPATPTERAGMHLAAGLMSLSRDQLEQAEREASLARTIAVEAGLGREVGEASGLLGMVAHRRGEWREVFRREFEQTVRATPAYAEFVFDAHLCLAEFSLHGPDGPTGVRSFANELLALAEERGSVLGTALATLMIGESKLLTGDLTDARRDLERAADLHSNVGASAGWALSLQRLAEQAVAVGHAARASPLLRRARAIAEASPLASHLLVRILATTVQAESDPAARMRSLDQAEADLVGREVCEPCSIELLVTAAVTCAVTHRADEARGWLDRADHVAGMWQGGPWSAAVWEARGQLRLAEGRPDQAAALFREAAEMFADSGRSMAAARCRHSAEAAMRPSGNGRGTSLR